MSNRNQLVAMTLSVLALSVAMNVRADDSSSSSSAKKGRPDRAFMEATKTKCESDSGITAGTRPTKEQHEKMRSCMDAAFKAAGYEKPPGPPPGGHHHGDHDGPPPGDAPPADAGGSSSSSAE